MKPVRTLLITLVVAGSVAAWTLEDKSAGVHALILPGSQALCIEADGEEELQGTLGGTMRPGDVVHGTIALTHCDPAPAALLDLDIGVTVGASEGPRLADRLVVESLSYGDDDLLVDDPSQDADRDLVAELDTNGDGVLTLTELTGGANDLEPPGAPSRPTLLQLGLLLAPETDNTFQGTSVDLGLTFYLSDKTGDDLNP